VVRPGRSALLGGWIGCFPYTSCISSSFWNNNKCSPSSESSTVRYSVTAQYPECVFTTVLEFHVCDDLPFDAVFGNDFITICAQSSGMFSPVTFLFITNASISTVTNPFLSPLHYIHMNIYKILII